MLDQGSNIYSAPWNSSLASDGLVTITIEANDTLGNLDALRTVNITVDNSNPGVIITSPGDGTDEADNVLIQATVTDDHLSSVWVVFTGNHSGTLSLAPQGSDVYAVTWDSNLATDGVVTITVNANDTLGNLNNSVSVSITVSML